MHPLLNSIDVYNEGKPTCIANTGTGEQVREPERLPVSEGIQERVFKVPLFYRYRPKMISEYASAFKKVPENYKELLPGDRGNPPNVGGWSASFGH